MSLKYVVFFFYFLIHLNIDEKFLNFLLQPGRKNLLLYSMLKKNENSKMDAKKRITIDRSGKRRKLPLGERRQLEKQQNDVIAAYRRLKAQKSAGIN